MADHRKRDKKRRKEAKKQKLTLAYQAKARATYARVSRYPEIIFEESAGTPEFVSLIKDAQRGIDLDDPRVCGDGIREAYQFVRQHGFDRYLADIRTYLADGGAFARGADMFDYEFMMHYGEALFRRIPEDVRKKHLPYNDVFIKFEGNQQVFFFSSLLKTKGDGGTIYHSRLAPTVTLGGHSWKVGFSRHAIDQAVLRLNPDYFEYSSSLDVHAFFANCVYHEPAEIDSRTHPHQPAFSMYDNCGGAEFLAYDVYARRILGVQDPDRDIDKGGLYFRLGYFPVVIDRGFAKATSFMRPGYTGTPELRLLTEAANLPREQKAFLLREARENTGQEALLGGRFEIVKWFHDNGIPQVRRFAAPPFSTRLKINEDRISTVSHKALVKETLKGLSRKDLKAEIRKRGR